MLRAPQKYPCPKCHEASLNPLECTRCGVIFAKFRAARPRVGHAVLGPDRIGRLHDLPLALRASLLPILMGLSWLLIQVPLFRAIAHAFGSIPFHEMGHAFFAWLGGRWAIPIGAIVPFVAYTPWSQERVYALALFFQVLAGWGVLKLWLGEFRIPALALGAVLIAMLHMTYIMPFEQTEKYAILGGIVGEFAITGATILLFHHPLPDRLRWDFFRFIAVIPACVGFVSSFRLWSAVSAGTEALPRGTLLVSRSDSSGDIDRLINLHGWTEASLISFMEQLRGWALAVIIAQYFYDLARHRSARS